MHLRQPYPNYSLYAVLANVGLLLVVAPAKNIVLLLQLLIYSRFWNGFLLGAVTLSFLCYVGISVVYNATIWKGLVSPDMFWVFFVVLANPTIPLCIVLLVMAALLPDVVIQIMETSQMRTLFLKHLLRFHPSKPMVSARRTFVTAASRLG